LHKSFNCKKSIYFWSTPELIDTLKHPLIGPVEVTLTNHTYGRVDTKVLPIGVNFDKKAFFKLFLIAFLYIQKNQYNK
jgi:hypothetical protein